MRLVLIAAVVVGGALLSAAALLWIDTPASPEPHLGEPPYRTRYEYLSAYYGLVGPNPGISGPVSAALRAFPDADACLANAWTKRELPASIDWELVNTVARAEVCLFRVFARLTDKTDAERWLAGQGFTIERDRIMVQPEDGTLCYNVVATWDIEQDGYLISPGLVWRMLYAPKSFFVSPVWCESEGAPRLEAVQVRFSPGW